MTSNIYQKLHIKCNFDNYMLFEEVQYPNMTIEVLCDDKDEYDINNAKMVFVKQYTTSVSTPNDLLLYINPDTDIASVGQNVLYEINNYFLKHNCLHVSQSIYFCVKMGVLHNLNVSINGVSYFECQQLCSEYKSDEPLHIVLATYERNANLERVFDMLCSQTVKNINLHLIDNNTCPELHKDINQIITQFGEQLKITLHRSFKNTHCIGRVLLIKELLSKYMMDYVVIFDDDQLYETDWLEYLIKHKKSMSTLGWYGKTYSVCDYWKSDITYTDLEEKRRRDINKFTYFGPGGCIFDARLFMFDKLYEYEKYSMDLPIFKMDDIWMSFVFNKYLDIPFYRAFKPPYECIDSQDLSKMTWFKLKEDKPKFMRLLCDTWGWDVISK